MKKLLKKNDLTIVAGFLVSGILLTVIQVPVGWSWLAWVAWVPFILVCSPGVKFRRLAVWGYVVATGYWLGNLYWIGPITWAGWAAFCLYTALLWPVLIFAIRFCRAKKVPLFLAVGVLIVGAERLQGLFLGGFFWRFLAHSQYRNITIIQIADIFGAVGVSFLIAMVNGLIAELILAARENNLFKPGQLSKIAVVSVMLVATIFYGRWRIEQSQDFVEDGPLVAAVQSNIPQSVKDSSSPEENERVFNDVVEQSRLAVSAGAELVVWPETIVPAILNTSILNMLELSHSYNVFDRAIRNHAREGAYILAGATGGKPMVKSDGMIELVEKYNSAFLYKDDGTASEKVYSKIHLVPFGEVVPFKKSAPWLHRILMGFTPYDFDYTLDAGTEYVVFEMPRETSQNEQNYRFGVLICYEDVFPAIAREFALDERSEKRVDWLVNISNDGWFSYFQDEKVYSASELAQHAAICVFRAVENRLAIVRSVNTGVSCLIDTVGRMRDGFEAGNLPAKAMKRQGITGWFADKMPIDKRVTLFSRYGPWVDRIAVLGLLVVVVIGLVDQRKQRRKKHEEKCKTGAV
ncbi:apolipoprotein N-acyltransferase [Planctomycetota bacterium]